MPVAVPLAIAGASVAGAAISSNASKSAANKISGATDRAAELQNQRFQQLLRLQMPGYQRGEQAAGLYMSALGFPSMTGGQQPQPQTVPQQPGMMTGGGSYTGGGSPGYIEAKQIGDGSYDATGGANFAPYDPNAPLATDGNVPMPQTVPGQSSQPDIASLVRGTPGYQGQLDQGLKAIDRAAPLVGGMYSGRRMKALDDYGQNTFGSYYQDWLDRVGGVAGQGQQTAQNVGAAGMQNASNVGGLMVQGANARANGSLSSAGAWNGALQNDIGMYGASQGWFK